MLVVKDLTQLTITRIQPFAVYFTYAGSSYMLHESSDGPESITSVWARNLTDKGFYTLDKLASTQGCIINHVLPPEASNQKKGLTYKQINTNYKTYFVKKLTSYALIEGIYAEEIKDLTQQYTDLTTQIEKLRKAQNGLWDTFFTT